MLCLTYLAMVYFASFSLFCLFFLLLLPLMANKVVFGYVICEHVNLIQKLFTKAFRWDLVSKKYNALLSDRDRSLRLLVVRTYVYITCCRVNINYDFRDSCLQVLDLVLL